MNERYKLNAQLALAFHPELDVAKSTAIHEYFVSLCAAKKLQLQIRLQHGKQCVQGRIQLIILQTGVIHQ